MIKIRTSMLSIGILLVAVTSGIGSITFAATPPANASPEIAIKIDNFSFSPATVTVPAGTTVRWTNHDDIPHTVVSEDKVFKSQVLDSDGDFTYTFTKPGTYSYFCSIHPKMVGKVVVQ